MSDASSAKAVVERLASLTDLLACPWCAAVGLSCAAHGTRAVLLCGSCGRSTRVEDGLWRAMGPRTVPRTGAQLSNVFPPTSRIYERLWRVRSLSLLSGRSFPISEELAELDAFVAPIPGQLLVDVACSEGLYARHLARSGAVVLAVDHALPFLRVAARRAAVAGVEIVPVQASAQHLPIAAAAVDGVVMGGSLNEIGDREAAVAEMARITRPGGRAFSMSLTKAAGRWGRALQAVVRPSGIAFPTEAETEALFERNALSVAWRAADRVVLRLGAVRETPEGQRLP